MASTATFGHPEIKFGAPPLYSPLRWIVGDGLARDLCLTGRRIDAAEALRIGLVSAFYESGEFSTATEKLALTLLEAPLDALKFSKNNFIENCAYGFEESFAIEHDKAFRTLLLPRFA
jgi:enoyl-CoA hydratase